MEENKNLKKIQEEELKDSLGKYERTEKRQIMRKIKGKRKHGYK